MVMLTNRLIHVPVPQALVLHAALAICCIVGAGYWANWAKDNSDGLFNFKTFREKLWNYLVVAVVSHLLYF